MNVDVIFDIAASQSASLIELLEASTKSKTDVGTIKLFRQPISRCERKPYAWHIFRMLNVLIIGFFESGPNAQSRWL